MKKLNPIFLLFPFLFFSFPNILQAQDFQDNGIVYRVTSDSEMTVEITRVQRSRSELALPEQVVHNDTYYAVTSIAALAFNGCTDISSVTIPASIINIDPKAFNGCTDLNFVMADEGNPVYETREFCAAIIRKADNTLVVGAANSDVPSSVTAIGDYAFFGRKNLTSITLPEGFNSIGAHAFEDCANLNFINCPSSLKSIGEEAFAGCTKLTKKILDQFSPILSSTPSVSQEEEQKETTIDSKEIARQQQERQKAIQDSIQANERLAKKAQKDALAKAEAEAKAKREAEAQAKREAEARKREAEARAKREAEARAKLQQQEKARSKKTTHNDPMADPFSFGLSAGLNFAHAAFDVSQGDHYGGITSFHFGPAINYQLHKLFALQAAVVFSGKGYTNDNHFDDYNLQAKAYFLDIPIEIAVTPVNTENLKLSIFAGPYAAIGVSGMIKELRYHDFEYSFFEKYDRFDYGASLGAAVLISKHYSIRAHYQLGLNSNYPNRCIGINLGYYF